MAEVSSERGFRVGFPRSLPEGCAFYLVRRSAEQGSGRQRTDLHWTIEELIARERSAPMTANSRVELQKLGFVVSERSVARYLQGIRRRGDPTKRWLTFLRNQFSADLGGTPAHVPLRQASDQSTNVIAGPAATGTANARRAETRPDARPPRIRARTDRCNTPLRRPARRLVIFASC